MHVGFILDGNGRWAANKSLPRSIGHKKGAENVEDILKSCKDLEISHVTLYAFSTENWSRPVFEIKALMKLFHYYLKKKLTKLYQENVKVVIIGDVRPFPKVIKDYIKNLEELTKNNDGMLLNLAMNYGGRSEIVRATKGIVKAVSDGAISIEDLDEQLFAQYLYTKKQKDPDLIIRTAGEKRLSNFLLWQSAYSELYFVDKNWPDFNRTDLIDALDHYKSRKRKYGSLETNEKTPRKRVI
ncbi:isoprenyl transferase [Paracoccaceae bacterium]|nr:isoprenyl transferase [Paracoccaceae bacterium]